MPIYGRKPFAIGSTLLLKRMPASDGAMQAVQMGSYSLMDHPALATSTGPGLTNPNEGLL